MEGQNRLIVGVGDPYCVETGTGDGSDGSGFVAYRNGQVRVIFYVNQGFHIVVAADVCVLERIIGGISGDSDSLRCQGKAGFAVAERRGRHLPSAGRGRDCPEALSVYKNVVGFSGFVPVGEIIVDQFGMVGGIDFIESPVAFQVCEKAFSFGENRGCVVVFFVRSHSQAVKAGFFDGYGEGRAVDSNGDVSFKE